MKRQPTSVAASVKARLHRLARDRGEDFNYVIIRYAQERLLYRLGRSRHRDLFVLKGATLFTLWEGSPHRPTKDLDLLARGDPDMRRLAEIFADVCSTQVPDDGLSFAAAAVTTEMIREEANYDGIRLHIPAQLGTARIRLQIDLGFGDSTVPPPETRTFPTLLNMAAPSLPSYPPETVIAEKLEAMVQLGRINSRMKDFYDIHYLSMHFDFDGERLVAAVDATFKRRRTALPHGEPAALTAAFAADAAKRQQWAAFTERIKTTAPTLQRTIEDLRAFLLPVLRAARRETRLKHWRRGGPW